MPGSAGPLRGLAGPLTLVAARARRSRSWILPTLALAVVVGFAGAAVSESVIVGDQSARAAVKRLDPINRAVRLVWEGPLTAYAVHTADTVFSRLGIPRPTRLLLLNPVRLSAVVVHPVGISPFERWVPASAIRKLGPCRPRECDVLQGSPGHIPAVLTTAGVRIRVVGHVALSSVPLGYSPATGGGGPILITGDIAGLGSIQGLSGVYRTYSWVGLVPLANLHSWSLPSFESRLRAAQAAVSPLATRFTFEGPFSGLDAARSRALIAVHRLLLVDGGVAVALVLFALLAAGALQRDQAAEIERLRHAGGRSSHVAIFLLAEAALMASAALVAGLGLGIVFTVILASGAGEPVGAVIGHGLLSSAAAYVLIGGWAAMIAVLALSPVLRALRIFDLAALVGAAVLIAGLSLGTGASSAWIGLLVPLTCLSAGLVLFRVIEPLLRAGEYASRKRSLTARLALLGLGRAGGTARLAIAFLAISTALAGFGLSFRATLIRGSADQAADRVPLDALISPGSTFATPLELAPPARWRALSDGLVFPIRRTQANYAAGGGTVTVPALGVPAAAIHLIHGWRDSDGPAPLAVLARRLRPPGPARTPGPLLPAPARRVELAVRSPNLDLDVTVDLRNRDGAIDRLALGMTGLSPRVLQARVPPGHWEVEAIELSELAGTAITNGHQNGENPAPATQFSARLTLGPLLSRGSRGELLTDTALGSWRAVGAASGASPASGSPTVTGRRETAVVFQTTGYPGVVRPPQPSDSRPLPILVDPATAAAAGPGGRLGLTVDGLPVRARVVGVLRRFPTIGQGAGGFVVADQALLSGALDSQLPGQGRPDELWISSSRTPALRRAVRSGPLAQLRTAYRTDVEQSLRTDPVGSGVTRTLLASGVVATLLALLGMLLVLVGPLRASGIEADLEEQGVGPRGLRNELRARFGAAGILGIWPGLLIALLLDRLTVAAVGAYENGTSQPALITVVPWLQLVALGAGLTVLCAAGGWAVGEGLLPRRRRAGRPAMVLRGTTAVDDLAQERTR